MTEDVPPALRPPVSLALAKAVESVPAEGALPGGCMYEPKWDGYRLCALTGTGGVSLWSRQNKDLTRYFPDLREAIKSQVPDGCVLDGEAVIWTADRLDFDALQRRLVASKAGLSVLVHEHPASFAVFDLLAVAGHDIRDAPLAQRRELLEQLSADWKPPLNLSPVTRDRTEALKWFEELPQAGLEGLVIKGAAQSYQGGIRQWWKVKSREVVDVVCAAVIGRIDRPAYVVVGRRCCMDGQRLPACGQVPEAAARTGTGGRAAARPVILLAVCGYQAPEVSEGMWLAATLSLTRMQRHRRR